MFNQVLKILKEINSIDKINADQCAPICKSVYLAIEYRLGRVFLETKTTLFQLSVKKEKETSDRREID